MSSRSGGGGSGGSPGWRGRGGDHGVGDEVAVGRQGPAPDDDQEFVQLRRAVGPEDLPCTSGRHVCTQMAADGQQGGVVGSAFQAGWPPVPPSGRPSRGRWPPPPAPGAPPGRLAPPWRSAGPTRRPAAGWLQPSRRWPAERGGPPHPHRRSPRDGRLCRAAAAAARPPDEGGAGDGAHGLHLHTGPLRRPYPDLPFTSVEEVLARDGGPGATPPLGPPLPIGSNRRALSSAVEHCPYKAGVGGSKPSAPTVQKSA